MASLTENWLEVKYKAELFREVIDPKSGSVADV